MIDPDKCRRLILTVKNTTEKKALAELQSDKNDKTQYLHP